ncbi:MAG TPA: phage major capsid protein, partial [Gemmatimonadales bacterium]
MKIDTLPDEQELGRYTMRELKREMQTRVTECRRMIDAGPAEKRSAEDVATFARLDEEMDRVEAAIEDRAKVDRRSMIARGSFDLPGGPDATPPDNRRFVGIDQRTGREVRAVLPGERLVDALNLSAEARTLSVGRFLRGLVTGDWQGAEAEHRALTVGEFVAGGALVPAPLAALLIDLARAQSVVIRLGAQTIPMPSTTLDLARVVTDPSATWYGEEVRATGLTEGQGSFGRLTLKAHTLAILERASVELAEDAPNFGQVLEQQLAAALALEFDRAVLFGITAQGWSGLRGNPDPWGLGEHSMGTNGAA